MDRVKTDRMNRFWEFAGTYGIFFVFVFLFAFNSLFTHNFYSINTVRNILSQSTTTVLLGIGMTVVIATAGINISVGSVMAVTAMVAGKLSAQGHLALGGVLGLLLAAVCGMFTGYLVIKFDIQPMIASLSMMFILRGAAKLLNNGKNMRPGCKEFNSFLYELYAGIPVRTIIWLIFAIIIFIIVGGTRFGICIESFGDNHRAARIAGINTIAVITTSYIICNVMAWAAGFIEMGYSGVVDPGNMGLSKEMDAIAATVLGGTSINGGKPHIAGTVVGALTLQMITIMANMNNVPSSYAKIIKAVIIILAVYVRGIRKSE